MIRKSYRTNKWILSDPVIAYRILRGVFRALVLRRNTLRVIQIFPTFDCQARCEMCSVAGFKQGGKDVLTREDYESIAAQGARMGAVAVTFLGGEPLLAKGIEDTIRTFKSRHFFVSIVSNGIAFSRDCARTLRAAGLDSIHFGLESLDEEANDKRRGYPGQCRKVLEGVKICREEGLNVGVCTILFPGELERCRELAEYGEENGLRVSLPTVAPVGAAERLEPATEEQYEQVLALLRQYPHLTVDWASSYSLRSRCPAGKEKIAITCYGEVMGCSLNHISFGNVREEPLQTIWERAGRFSQFRKHSDHCIAGFDHYHINNYLAPIADLDERPVHYSRHPNITEETEPDLFER